MLKLKANTQNNIPMIMARPLRCGWGRGNPKEPEEALIKRILHINHPSVG